MFSVMEYLIPSVDGKILTVLLLILFTLLYLNHVSNFNYWKKFDVPEIPWRKYPLFGHSARMILARTTFFEFFLDLYKAMEGKPFAGFYQGTKPFILVSDPEIIRHILVKDFSKFVNRGFEIDEKIDPLNGKALTNLKDQRWKEMRNRLSPTFTSGRMRAMFPIMRECTNEMNNCIKNKLKQESKELTLDIKDFLTCFTTDVIATCGFGVKCDSLNQPETSEFRKMGKLLFKVTWVRSLMVVIFFIAPQIFRLLRLKFNFSETEIFFRNFVKDSIEKREQMLEKDGEVKGAGDFIQLLVLLKKHGMHALQKNELSETKNEVHDDDKIISQTDNSSWKELTLDDLTAQVLLFFTAGFESTSAQLTYALFELSSSENAREIQQNLRKEILTSIEENNGNITYESLQKMTLLDRVLSETMRLHPPAGVLSRICSEPYTLPGTNVTLEKNTVIFIPIHGMQLDPKYFRNPTKFDPDRFLPENKEKRENFTYIPFGEGPRMCIGQRFAQMQARLALASLLSKFEFELCTEKTKLPFKYDPRSFSTMPKGGIWLKIRELE